MVEFSEEDSYRRSDVHEKDVSAAEIEAASDGDENVK